MSYTRTASCVATAYTIRYGSANAEGGPGGGFVVSDSNGRSDAAGIAAGEGDGIAFRGGGSMEELDKGSFDGRTGSGKGVISPSDEEESRVMCLVVVVCRKLYRIGEHRTAIDGFLWPGR